MNALLRTTFRVSAAYSLRAIAVMGLAALTACSGGGGKDQVRIGSGQSTDAGTVSGADFPVFYVKRVTPDFTQPTNPRSDDLRLPRPFSTNADLYMRERSSPSATETNITARVHPSNERWDVKDVDVSPDGKKVIFAMRGPIGVNQDDDEAPTWNIWEYDIANDDLHPVISSAVTREEGQDVSPHYLPDGHILFSSTRQYQSKGVLTDEGKGQFEAQNEDRNSSTFSLHVMGADGSNIQQISFNQSNDTDATVLSNGRILYSRWDHMRGTNRNGIHFYTTKPDGSDTQLLYGANSHAVLPNTAADGTVTYPAATQYASPKELPDGRILTLVKPFNGTEQGGDLYIVDTANYVEQSQPLVGSSASGAAATKAVPTFNVQIIAGPSVGGRFVSAAPLWDGTGRILISWTQCRVIDPTTQAAVNCTTSNVSDPAFTAAPPIYSLWMLNPNEGTQLPIVAPTAGVMVTDVVIAQSRTTPPAFLAVNPDGNPLIDQTLKNEVVGILDIRSVYDFDGAQSSQGTGCSIATDSDPTTTCFATRPARFLRLEKAVSLPSRDVRNIDNATAFGASNYMREILGYVPIEPDGSVRVKVPGNVAFRIAITDAKGRNLTSSFPSHNAWLSIRPGETVQCNGCHRVTNPNTLAAGQSGRSHGRSGTSTSVYAGAVGSSFPNANSTFTAITGQTMAQARAAWSCVNEQCASITPSVNLIFANVWPSATVDSRVIPATPPRTGDTALVYSGTGGLTTKVPTNNSSCLQAWNNKSYVCRITINYLEHIQPIWERPLGVDVNGDMVVDSLDTCQSCHNRVNAANATQIPAGQLELTSDASDQNGAGTQVTAYRELLFTDNELELVGTVLQDRCIQFAIDPVTGLPTTNCLQFATVSPPLAARNAAASRFFPVFESNQCMNATTCTFDHRNLLTPGELRLISEWVDIGAQYYNDPFKAPVN